MYRGFTSATTWEGMVARELSEDIVGKFDVNIHFYMLESNRALCTFEYIIIFVNLFSLIELRFYRGEEKRLLYIILVVYIFHHFNQYIFTGFNKNNNYR